MTPSPHHAQVIAAITANGGPDGFSRRFDISLGHIHAVIRGKAQPGPKTLKAAGVRS